MRLPLLFFSIPLVALLALARPFSDSRPDNYNDNNNNAYSGTGGEASGGSIHDSKHGGFLGTPTILNILSGRSIYICPLLT